jgi:hypothetical protein
VEGKEDLPRNNKDFDEAKDTRSEIEVRRAFLAGDATASPTLSDGTRMTKDSHPNMFGSSKKGSK